MNKYQHWQTCTTEDEERKRDIYDLYKEERNLENKKSFGMKEKRKLKAFLLSLSMLTYWFGFMNDYWTSNVE